MKPQSTLSFGKRQRIRHSKFHTVWLPIAAAAITFAVLSACSTQAEAPPGTVPVAPGAQPAVQEKPVSIAAPSGVSPAPIPRPAATPPASPETLVRREFEKWKNVPYRDNGATQSGIGNAGLARVIFEGAFGVPIPKSYDQQIRMGKLVDRSDLAPGDLVFFEGDGFGPFRSKTVGVFLGSEDVALARKEDGVIVARLSEKRWESSYKTARRMPRGEVAAPTFDLAKYGTNRGALLRDIAQAWSGTLYKAGGKTFEGIGYDEFVREVYGAIYETDLNGDPKTWEKMGEPVARDKLEAGDIILYDAKDLGGIIRQRHAGIYIGNGEFASAVKGSAVAISKLADPTWEKSYRMARRIDPDVLARREDAGGRADDAGAEGVAVATGSPRSVSDPERQLRAVTDSWRGTPYKLGGASRSGIDCSAFSLVLYEDVYNVKLPRTAEEQERLGKRINREGLETGDLVFFRTQGMGPLFRSRHVGVYLGGGEFAQASGRHGVTVSRLDNRYWSRKFQSARRIQ